MSAQIITCRGGKPSGGFGFDLERVFHRLSANVQHNVHFYIQFFPDKADVRREYYFRIDRQYELECATAVRPVKRMCHPRETHDFIIGPLTQLFTKTGLYSYFLYVDSQLVAHCNIVAI